MINSKASMRIFLVCYVEHFFWLVADSPFNCCNQCISLRKRRHCLHRKDVFASNRCRIRSQPSKETLEKKKKEAEAITDDHSISISTDVSSLPLRRKDRHGLVWTGFVTPGACTKKLYGFPFLRERMKFSLKWAFTGLFLEFYFYFVGCLYYFWQW